MLILVSGIEDAEDPEEEFVYDEEDEQSPTASDAFVLSEDDPPSEKNLEEIEEQTECAAVQRSAEREEEEELVFYRVSPRRRVSAADEVLALKQKYVEELVAKKALLEKSKKITDFFKVKKKRSGRCRIEAAAKKALREGKPQEESRREAVSLEALFGAK